MGNVEGSGFVSDTERDPLEIARARWGVNLADDHATLKKLHALQGQMPDVADLSNLWQEYQQRGSGGMERAA